MVDILNGKDEGPLAGWVIACVHGQTMLGLSHPGYIEPAYGLVCLMQMVQPDPRQPPQLMTMRNVTPLLTYPHLRRADLPEDALVFKCELLSKQERKDLARSVEACEQLIGAMRAQESGITLAPPGAKLPPMRRP